MIGVGISYDFHHLPFIGRPHDPACRSPQAQRRMSGQFSILFTHAITLGWIVIPELGARWTGGRHHGA